MWWQTKQYNIIVHDVTYVEDVLMFKAFWIIIVVASKGIKWDDTGCKTTETCSLLAYSAEGETN